MSCPICGPSESAAIADGVRAGVVTLVIVTALVVAGITWFAWKLWRLRNVAA
jgi:hypothetical protein